MMRKQTVAETEYYFTLQQFWKQANTTILLNLLSYVTIITLIPSAFLMSLNFLTLKNVLAVPTTIKQWC